MKKLLLVAVVGTSLTAFAAPENHGRRHHRHGLAVNVGPKSMETYDALNVTVETRDTPRGTAEIKKAGLMGCVRFVKKTDGDTTTPPSVEGEAKYGCAMFGALIRHPHRGPRGPHDDDQTPPPPPSEPAPGEPAPSDPTTGDQGDSGSEPGDQGDSGSEPGDQGDGTELLIEALATH